MKTRRITEGNVLLNFEPKCEIGGRKCSRMHFTEKYVRRTQIKYKLQRKESEMMLDFSTMKVSVKNKAQIFKPKK